MRDLLGATEIDRATTVREYRLGGTLSSRQRAPFSAREIVKAPCVIVFRLTPFHVGGV
jgi:hypothetical protein